MLDVTTHFNPQFSATVLFTEEASYTQEGIFNIHNAHMCEVDNAHANIPWKSQQKLSVNGWAGILSPSCIDVKCTGHVAVRHEDDLSDFTYLGLNYLDVTYQRGCIGCE
ncbi:uncharacterized protein NPIL_584221 [Nephila pilipes]|uniref:Uncharacterized protein n=1 Tax=Nephila pilipes TaxID=299642 RepID=A0A8X6T1S7_NEPPI|nr:uncharacterized protein NPIL_584221 [Nephila pilipes]